MTTQIIRGNALDLPLADDSVDLVVTSPPYFGLRSYQDGGEHYDGQIGDEATPAEFVDALIAATREMVRVVKPSGSIFVNLGDKYAADGRATRPQGTSSARLGRSSADAGVGNVYRYEADVRPKSLMGIPWRYALRCIDDLGLILRAEIIWSKPNGLPESVQDRVRRSHEQWFHFVLNPRYYSAVDHIREPHMFPNQSRTMGDSANGGTHSGERHKRQDGAANPLGKLPGSVWTIPTEPLHVPESLGVDHFAAFPTEWPRRIITGWSPRGICVECGEGRRPVVCEVQTEARDLTQRSTSHFDTAARYGAGNGGNTGMDKLAAKMRDGIRPTITGEACACPQPTAPTRPGVVLDPFGGTGTTALVADTLGRHGISVDMSRDYCRLATWRTSDPKQQAKAARREYKPPREQLDGQLDLLEGLGA